MKDYNVLNFCENTSPDEKRKTIELRITEILQDENGNAYTQLINELAVVIPYSSEFYSILKKHQSQVCIGLDLSDFKRVSNDIQSQFMECYVDKILLIQDDFSYQKALQKYQINHIVL